MNDDGVTPGRSADGGHRPVRRRDAAAERRRHLESDRCRQANQVHIGGRKGDVLGEPTPAIETGLPLVRAHLVVAGLADQTAAARAHERNGDAVPHAPARDVWANGGNRPRELMSGHMGKLGDVVVPVPAVPVTAAQSRRLHLEDDAVIRGSGIGDIANMPRSAEGVVQDCAHAGSLEGSATVSAGEALGHLIDLIDEGAAEEQSAGVVHALELGHRAGPLLLDDDERLQHAGGRVIRGNRAVE